MLTRLTRFTSSLLLAAALVVPGLALAAKPQYPQQAIMGWVEFVYIQDIDAKLKAKLDTGATTSSMRAEVLKIVKAKEKGEQPSVVFQVEGADGKTTTLQRKLVRWVRIKSRGKDDFHRRPVVEMEFCVAGRRVHSEVNLAPRADFVYPILVGRNMLVDAGIIVDSNKTYTYKTRCPAAVED